MPNRNQLQYIDFRKKVLNHSPSAWFTTDEVAGVLTVGNIINVGQTGSYSPKGIYYQQDGLYSTANGITMDGYIGCMKINISSITSLSSNYTIIFNFRTIGIRNNYANILDITDGSNHVGVIRLAGNNNGLSLKVGGLLFTGPYLNNLNNDSWNAIAVVNDGTVVKMYLNGELYVTSTVPSSGIAPTSIAFGAILNAGVASGFSRVGISDVIVFNNSAKLANEIRTLFYDDVDNGVLSDEASGNIQLTVNAPLTGGGYGNSLTVGIDSATSSRNGYLTSVDFTTFSNKLDSVPGAVVGNLSIFNSSGGIEDSGQSISSFALLSGATFSGPVVLFGDATVGNQAVTYNQFTAPSGVVAGTYGDSTNIPVVTVNTVGKVVNITTVPSNAASISSLNSEISNRTAADNLKVNKAGDTMTGQLVLPGGGTGNDAITYNEAQSLISSPTGVIVGSYGSATQVGTFTVNSTGDLTAAANVTITPDWSSITNTPTTIVGYGITDALTTSLTNDNIWVGNGSNVATAVVMSGDATLTNAGVITLKNTGVAGTYGSASLVPTITTDAQGRVLSVVTNAISTSTNLSYTPSATDGVVNSSTGTDATIPAATPSLAGLMTAADKTKIDGLPSTVPSTDLALGSVTATTQDITNTNGTGFTLPSSTVTDAGLMSAADKTVVDAVAVGPVGNVWTGTGTGAVWTPLSTDWLPISAVVITASDTATSKAQHYVIPSDLTSDMTITMPSGAVGEYMSFMMELTMDPGKSVSFSPSVPGCRNLQTTGDNNVWRCDGGTTWILISQGGLGFTNLSVVNVTPTTVDVASSSGTSATIPAATDADAGLMSGSDKTLSDALRNGGTTGYVWTAGAGVGVSDWAPGGAPTFKQTIGDGTSVVYTVTHNLNTQDIIASVVDLTTFQQEIPSVSFPTLNTAVFTFAVAPASSSKRVLIQSI